MPGQQIVVTLVHGTFARDAAWIRPGSPLRNALTHSGCRVHTFKWSGRNSHLARCCAVKELTDQLTQQVGRDPDKEHWVIAHSHGGNIAVHAANAVRRGSDESRRVPVITLATPFIHARTRRESSSTLELYLIIVVFGAFLIALAGVRAWAGPHSFLDWATIAFGIIFTVQVILCLIGAYMHGGPVLGKDKRSDLLKAIHTPAVDYDDVIVVRSAADEASGFLILGQFTGWLSAWLTGLFGKAAVLLMLIGVSTLLPHDLALVVKLAFGAAGLTVIALVTTLLGASLAFGLDGPFVSLYLFTTAEAAPPGKSAILQLEPLTGIQRRGLAHSALYGDEKVIGAVVETIRGSPKR